MGERVARMNDINWTKIDPLACLCLSVSISLALRCVRVCAHRLRMKLNQIAPTPMREDDATVFVYKILYNVLLCVIDLLCVWFGSVLCDCNILHNYSTFILWKVMVTYWFDQNGQFI